MRSPSLRADVDADQLRSGRWIAQAIEGLDPQVDNELATHLSLGVRYGDAFFAHTAYSVAFVRQMAVPRIARTVYRTGTGDMMANVRRRNDHTLVFFGEMIRHGHSSPAGRRVIDRMEEIHARFGVRDDDKLFTLASLTFEGSRILGDLGLTLFTPAEDVAHYNFWRGVGEVMGLGVPGSRDDFLAWTHAFEREQLAASDAGREILRQVMLDWQRWFPGALRGCSDPVFVALLGPELRTLFGFSDPPPWATRFIRLALDGYNRIQAVRPHRLGRSWSDHFASNKAAIDIAHYGHQGKERVAQSR
ncbi:MAG TPA: oxygenase MpaB family protein [Aeromicrobium sp.]|nr:oxygenase MpaB family protein [Aeromicrobium sp.]